MAKKERRVEFAFPILVCPKKRCYNISDKVRGVRELENYAVLISDDNEAIHSSLTCYLEAEGIEVISAYDGESALEMLRRRSVDLIVLDLMLPGIDGYETCREIRKQSDVPIIMISARGEDIDRIIGLEIGADDYLTKPVSPREVTIRIKKALKRSHPREEPKKYILAELTLYPDSYQTFVNGREINLTAKEFDVLLLLVANAGKVLSRERILNAAWSYDYLLDTRLVDGMIKRLRQKLPKEGVHFSIQSVYGAGYKIVEEVP